VRIDLHSHSTASDGTDPPAEVMRRAGAAGLDVIALTDHDTLAGHPEAREALPDGLTLVGGMEMSCRMGGRSVHLLAYLVDPADEGLAAERRAISADRLRRGRDMVGRLRDLGAEVSWDQVSAIAAGGVVGRPHIARAMAEAGIVERPDQAFTAQWLGEGGRAHVARYAPAPARAIALIRAAGGVAVLAHPGAAARGARISDEVIAGLAEAGLAGLEVAHPDHIPPQRQRLAGLARDLGLARTGGSDDHGSLSGHRLGCEVTEPAEFERLMAQATGAAPASRPRPPARGPGEP
jgi:3',5'-nucleoside bisphosphate phosphatase